MKAITFYESNGAITAVLQGDQIVIDANKAATTENWIDGLWDGKTHYVLDGTATLRPDCPALLDGSTLTYLPAPCVIDINGVHYDCNEDTAEIDLGLGAHQITVLAFPYLNGVFNVEN
jgi:hypothetical protein